MKKTNFKFLLTAGILSAAIGGAWAGPLEIVPTDAMIGEVISRFSGHHQGPRPFILKGLRLTNIKFFDQPVLDLRKNSNQMTHFAFSGEWVYKGRGPAPHIQAVGLDTVVTGLKGGQPKWKLHGNHWGRRGVEADILDKVRLSESMTSTSYKAWIDRKFLLDRGIKNGAKLHVDLLVRVNGKLGRVFATGMNLFPRMTIRR